MSVEGLRLNVNYRINHCLAVLKQSSSEKNQAMRPISQPDLLRVRFEGTDRGSATVRLLWDAAPKTCAAIVDMLDGDGRLRVRAVHGRHSGHEALFLTPKLCTLGDENTTLDYELGDFLFGYEPAGICQHGDVSVSEVAWIYGPTAQPRRSTARRRPSRTPGV